MSEVLHEDYERERTITRAEIMHALNDTINLDMCSEGQIWTDLAGYDYDMHFWGIFRKVA